MSLKIESTSTKKQCRQALNYFEASTGGKKSIEAVQKIVESDTIDLEPNSEPPKSLSLSSPFLTKVSDVLMNHALQNCREPWQRILQYVFICSSFGETGCSIAKLFSIECARSNKDQSSVFDPPSLPETWERNSLSFTLAQGQGMNILGTVSMPEEEGEVLEEIEKIVVEVHKLLDLIKLEYQLQNLSHTEVRDRNCKLLEYLSYWILLCDCQLSCKKWEFETSLAYHFSLVLEPKATQNSMLKPIFINFVKGTTVSQNAHYDIPALVRQTNPFDEFEIPNGASSSGFIF
mmetsp:Transcript_9936/g.12937  ORF Transcript_9936/g.12937 Transcript_9936/m.12937 type:complete len:290 (+) Transcript_9936:203-1072(+)